MDALFGMEDNEVPATSGEKVEEHLVKLESEGDYPVLYALVWCHSDSFSLQVTDAKTSWEGKLSHSQISRTAKSAKTSETDLLSDTRRALIRCDAETNSNYLYTTGKRAGGGLELTWKKRLGSGSVKVQLGKLFLEAQSVPSAVGKMLDYAVRKIDDQQQSIGELEIERERLVGERASALKQLEKTVLLKETIESDLYGKFMCVLNEKKAKIRRLMESLDHLSQQTAGNKRPVPTRTRAKNGGSDGTSSDEGDSDDDVPSSKAEVSLDPVEPQPAIKPGPSSLLQEDVNEGEEKSPPVKRRRRRETKKPGAPSIPRPPSICSTPSTSGVLGRVTRSSSAVARASRKTSEESLGSQDLLKLL